MVQIECISNRIVEIVIGGGFAFVAGYALWPPRNVYWDVIFSGDGGILLIALLLFLSLLLGAVFGAITGIRLTTFVSGGCIAYFVGMWLIERVLDPISPVHFIGYGVLLVGLVVGVAVSDSVPEIRVRS